MSDAWDLFDDPPGDDTSGSTSQDSAATHTQKAAPQSPAKPVSTKRLAVLCANLHQFVSTYGSGTAEDLSNLSDKTDAGIAAQLVYPAVSKLVEAVEQMQGALLSGTASGPAVAGAIAAHTLEVGQHIVEQTWAWLRARGSWPHVAWREAYVIAQLSCAVAHLLSPTGNAADAMRCADLALILGAPAADTRDLVDGVEAEYLTRGKGSTGGPAAAAGAGAARAAGQGVNLGAGQQQQPPLPVIPAVLRSDATLSLPAGFLAAVAAGGGEGGADTTGASSCTTEYKGKITPRIRGRARHPSRPLYEKPSDEHPVLARLRTAPSQTTSVSEFRARYCAAATSTAGGTAPEPVVIQGAIDDWPAMTRWRDLRQLSSRFGHRTVPVEIGRHLSSTWRESPMKIEEFLRMHVAPAIQWGWGKAVTLDDGVQEEAGYAPDEFTPGCMRVHSSRVAYLAQHALLEQLPGLAADMDLPLYAGGEDGKIGAANAWLGTAGTITRCHYDSYDNTLCQVVGYKFVRLYRPSDTDKLYPIQKAGAVGTGQALVQGDATTSQGNISSVDVECDPIDPSIQSRFPSFADAVPWDTVLGPGDALFIPKGWWHYVRSLTPSFSINFWY